MSYFYSLRAAKEPPWRLAHGIWSAVQQLDLDTTQPKEFTLNTLASMLDKLEGSDSGLYDNAAASKCSEESSQRSIDRQEVDNSEGG